MDAEKKRRWGRQSDGSQDGGICSEQRGSVNATASAPARPPVKVDNRGAAREPYVFDMETGDPDDVLTLLLLAAHPRVDLRAVTITPGSMEQVELVRWILAQVGLPEVAVGAQDWPNNVKKQGCMRGAFYASFGRLKTAIADCEDAAQLLRTCCDERTTLVTGAPLHNLGAAVALDGFRLGRWVAQGGYAGEGVVPRELQMDKFYGKAVCQTWNFNGNVEAAELALSSKAIHRKILVSKNVCHRVVYDDDLHGFVAKAMGLISDRIARSSIRMLHDAMQTYLAKKPGGKKMHDPLAFAVAIDESVCTLAEVQMYRDRGGWGARLCPGSGIWISVDYDDNAFRFALLPWMGEQ
mmetsp:Transcript_63817/g.118602  ORF Transcript_63817/g.118602 Transcript_63817/m.118602 type:complete len:352 (-) Transcript_63817:108-1163(-)